MQANSFLVTTSKQLVLPRLYSRGSQNGVHEPKVARGGVKSGPRAVVKKKILLEKTKYGTEELGRAWPGIVAAAWFRHSTVIGLGLVDE